MKEKEKMKNKRVKEKILFLLLTCSMVIPIPAQAAEPLRKEKAFISSADSEEEFAKHVSFDNTIKENGKTYRLDGITYKVTEKNYLEKKEKQTESDLISEGGEYTPPETITENGITYTLQDSVKETQENESEQTVTAYEEYSHAVTEADVPAEKTVSAVNEKTGETESVTCVFSGISQNGTTKAVIPMSITFQGYDADYYEWNGNRILRNDEKPALNGYENQLLKSAGITGTVLSIAWDGNPYMADGVLCRNAVATVEQQIPVYRANYTGKIRESRNGVPKYICNG